MLKDLSPTSLNFSSQLIPSCYLDLILNIIFREAFPLHTIKNSLKKTNQSLIFYL